jgi:hypothetical protein
MSTEKRMANLWRHITEVQRNCYLLGIRLIEGGEEGLGRRLISNSLAHDQSKFHGIEWDMLSLDGDDIDQTALQAAITQHNRTNMHHPEYWGTINDMPDVHIAEMVADWKARSSEFGTSLQEWIDVGAAERFAYTKNSKVYKKIKRFANLLVDKAFA